MAAQPGTPPASSPRQKILGTIIGFWQSQAVAAAAELGIADLLAKGPLHIDVLAKQTGTDSRSLFRLMRALESMGIFAQAPPRTFANSAASNCLRENVPGSLRATIRSVLLPGGGEYDAWAGFAHSLQTGKPGYDHVFGYNFWEFLKRRPDKAEVFNESQKSYNASFIDAIARAYDWGRYGVIADIGGGSGSQLRAILERYPACRGILFDSAEAVCQALPHTRLERQNGSFFDSVPAGADLYMLKTVIHDWADSDAITILANVRKAVPPGGRLALVEEVISESVSTTPVKWVDLHMLALFGGAERTRMEYRDLFAKAGFEFEDLVPSESPFSILVARPC